MAPPETNSVAELKALKIKRGTFKGQITQFKTFLERCRVDDTPDLIKLEIRMQRLKSTFDGFDTVQTNIEILDEETDHSEERFAIEEAYVDALADAQRLINALTSEAPIRDNNRGSDRDNESIEANTPRAGTSTRRIRLPEAVLPTFDGQYENWLSFKDTFTSMIHNDVQMSNIEKLQYLKSALKGEAARKVQIFSITEANYRTAWQLLEETYSDKRILVSRHLNMLLRAPIQERESAEGLTRLADDTQQHVLSLRSLGVDVTEEIIVQILENKLHKSTLERWDETLEKGVFPKLSDMLDFLGRRAARIAKRGDQEVSSSSSSSFNKSNKYNRQTNQGKRPPQRTQTFVTSTGKACPVCEDVQHPLYRCEKFRKLAVPKRIKVVKDAGLCMTCLNTNHEQKDCKLGNCKLCDQRHNTLLHQQREEQASTSRV